MFNKPSEEFVKEGAQKVTENDIETVVTKSEDIEEKFKARGPLKRFVEDYRVLKELIRDYRGGRYRQALYGTIAAAVFALLYVLIPSICFQTYCHLSVCWTTRP